MSKKESVGTNKKDEKKKERRMKMKKEKNKNEGGKEVIADLSEMQTYFKEAERESGELLNSPEKVEDKLDAATNLIEKIKGGPLFALIEDIGLMVDIVQAYIKKEYREIPYKSIVAILAAIIYVVNPVDVIPDVIPGIGYIDDAFIVSLVMKMVHEDLQDYKIWKGNK